MKKIRIFLVLLLIAGIQIAFAHKTITGKVTNKEDGLGMPGVTVIVTGTTIGSITDASGNYNISVPAGATSLSATFIGMIPMEVPIGSLR